jgi:uncharacterized glyoxalase superfamily protein PhnB
MARLEQVNVVVGNMDAMVTFYEKLGVDVRESSPRWAAHHRSTGNDDGVDLDLDSETFASVWDSGWPGGSGVVLGFRVEDRRTVDRTYDELTAAGYVGPQPPNDAFWGARYAIVADPDGNAVGIMSPVDEGLRTAPPTDFG